MDGIEKKKKKHTQFRVGILQLFYFYAKFQLENGGKRPTVIYFFIKKNIYISLFEV